jgi:hypothetical protein
VMEVLLSAVEGREPVRLVHIALTLALQARPVLCVPGSLDTTLPPACHELHAFICDAARRDQLPSHPCQPQKHTRRRS